MFSWSYGLSTGAPSLVPRPFSKIKRRKGLLHIVGTCIGRPQKNLGESDTIVYSPFIVHITTPHAKSTSDHHGNTTSRYGDASACVYQALPPPTEGPGYEAKEHRVSKKYPLT